MRYTCNMNSEIFIGQAILDLEDNDKGIILDIRSHWTDTIVQVWWSLKGRTGIPLKLFNKAIANKELFIFPKIELDLPIDLE